MVSSTPKIEGFDHEFPKSMELLNWQETTPLGDLYLLLSVGFKKTQIPFTSSTLQVYPRAKPLRVCGQ